MTRFEYEYFREMRINNRCIEIANWLIDNPRDSVRKISKEFCVSKSQVHRDLHNLRFIDDDLYIQCMNILKKHKIK